MFCARIELKSWGGYMYGKFYMIPLILRASAKAEAERGRR